MEILPIDLCLNNSVEGSICRAARREQKRIRGPRGARVVEMQLSSREQQMQGNRSLYCENIREKI